MSKYVIMNDTKAVLKVDNNVIGWGYLTEQDAENAIDNEIGKEGVLAKVFIWTRGLVGAPRKGPVIVKNCYYEDTVTVYWDRGDQIDDECPENDGWGFYNDGWLIEESEYNEWYFLEEKDAIIIK